MKEFFVTLYSNPSFPIYLGAIIIVLVVAFFVVFFLGKRDKRNYDRTQQLKKLEEPNAFNETTTPVKVEAEPQVVTEEQKIHDNNQIMEEEHNISQTPVEPVNVPSYNEVSETQDVVYSQAAQAPVQEPVQQAPVQEPVFEAPVVEPTPVVEAVAEQAPVQEPVFEAPVIEPTPVVEEQVQQAPVQEPVFEAPVVEPTPVVEEPVQQAPVQEPVFEAPVIEPTPVVEEVVQQAPVQEPVFEAPVIEPTPVVEEQVNNFDYDALDEQVDNKIANLQSIANSISNELDSLQDEQERFHSMAPQYEPQPVQAQPVIEPTPVVEEPIQKTGFQPSSVFSSVYAPGKEEPAVQTPSNNYDDDDEIELPRLK